jgi:hypothetical protein
MTTWLEYTALKGGLGVPSFAVIEKVGPMPTDGRSSLAKFMMNYGALQMAVASIDVPCEEVLPSRWQQGLHISPRKKSEGRVVWKNRLRRDLRYRYRNTAVNGGEVWVY